MWYIKWIFRVLFVAIVFAFFHYTLPQRDIVRVIKTEIIRQDFSRWNRIFFAQADAGNEEGVSRDLRLIETAYDDGSTMIFRNEDTGFGWPLYFKFDSSDLQAKAADLGSTREEPVWVAITHYGWRIKVLTIYPNAISVRKVDGPDVWLIPWLNITILMVLGLLLLGVYRMVQRFRRRRIDPLLARFKDSRDRAEIRTAQTGETARPLVRNFLRHWFGGGK
ncbi:MAG: DUF1523 family protein [Rhodobacteraceae bacterium]|nr:DUF1523 family protein [Paracoccaceae bacterium]